MKFYTEHFLQICGVWESSDENVLAQVWRTNEGYKKLHNMEFHHYDFHIVLTK